MPGLSAASTGRHVHGHPVAGGVAGPGLGPVGPGQPAGFARRCCGRRADRVAHRLREPRAFRHSIADPDSNPKSRANADPDAIHDRDAVAYPYRNTLALSELRAAVRGQTQPERPCGRLQAGLNPQLGP